MTGAIALAVFVIGFGVSLLGDACHVASGTTPAASGLLGVAPWLPCLYFAAGAVASGLWRALEAPGINTRAA